ncbi:MAG: site-specific integrase [Cytophaga sp.]|uniref:site-specific integrase n=1 Tax=Cytophaga sp. TaxID=29535 RepID=UPI003F7EE04E
MKKPTNFSKYITDFLKRYLPHERGAGKNTVNAYRDCFVLLLQFIENIKNKKVEKLTLENIKKETIVEFLDWIQLERGCSNSTRNSRLAAIHSFYKYLSYENLEYLHECQKILSIPFKKAKKESINYLTIEGMKLLLEQPDLSNARGRRDLTMIAFAYDTGARVQEIIDLTPSMINFNDPATINITGKGYKTRTIPMLPEQIIHLKNYLKENKLNEPHVNMYPVFFNSRKEKLTRQGVNHILDKYIKMARVKNESLFNKKFSCHSLRHSKAMHMLQAGAELVYIRDILGHSSVITTEIYARVDSKHKRLALEKAYTNINPTEESKWENNKDVRDWLKSL